jgi:hypothetical protein
LRERCATVSGTRNSGLGSGLSPVFDVRERVGIDRMDKRGGRGSRAAHGGTRSSRPISGARPMKSTEKPGLGAADFIGILVVIAFLVLAFGALVAKHNERSKLPTWEWVERLTTPLNSWISRSEAGEAPPPAPQGDH